MMTGKFTTTPSNLEYRYGIFTYGDIPGLTTLTFNHTTSLGGFDIESCSLLNTIAFPALTDIDPDKTQNGGLWFSKMSSINSISAPYLTTIGGTFGIDTMPNLTEISGTFFPSLTTVKRHFYFLDDIALTSASFPNLTTVSGTFLVYGCHGITNISSSWFPSLDTVLGQFLIISCNNVISMSFPSLVTANFISIGDTNIAYVNLPNWVPVNGAQFDAAGGGPGIGAPLSASSVNHILSRCVANAAFMSGVISLNGDECAAPTGQGIVDYNTLIGRGVVVTTGSL